MDGPGRVGQLLPTFLQKRIVQVSERPNGPPDASTLHQAQTALQSKPKGMDRVAFAILQFICTISPKIGSIFIMWRYPNPAGNLMDILASLLNFSGKAGDGIGGMAWKMKLLREIAQKTDKEIQAFTEKVECAKRELGTDQDYVKLNAEINGIKEKIESLEKGNGEGNLDDETKNLKSARHKLDEKTKNEMNSLMDLLDEMAKKDESFQEILAQKQHMQTQIMGSADAIIGAAKGAPDRIVDGMKNLQTEIKKCKDEIKNLAQKLEEITSQLGDLEISGGEAGSVSEETLLHGRNDLLAKIREQKKMQDDQYVKLATMVDQFAVKGVPRAEPKGSVPVDETFPSV
jgi:predicted  nucleic acid-binding Zn-ribbon protein